MNSSVLLLVFFVCILISVFYWQVVHAVLIRNIRFHLFAYRDRLRRLAIDGEEDLHSFAYRYLEGFICKAIGVLPEISLLHFGWFCFKQTTPSDEARRFAREGSENLSNLRRSVVREVILVMALNSPILISCSTMVMIAAWISGKGNWMIIYRNAESFIDELTLGGNSVQGVC